MWSALLRLREIVETLPSWLVATLLCDEPHGFYVKTERHEEEIWGVTAEDVRRLRFGDGVIFCRRCLIT